MKSTNCRSGQSIVVGPESLAWYRATTLAERLRSLRGSPDPEQQASPGAVDEELAKKRLREWRSSHTELDDDTSYAERLALDGMTEAELLRLLGEPIEAVRDRSQITHPWSHRLIEAYNTTPSRLPSRTADGHPINGPDNPRLAGFANVIGPLIESGRDRVRSGLQEMSDETSASLFSVETVEDLLVPGLLSQLNMVLMRTLILELNVSRLRGDLSGETSEERFEEFMERLRDREVALAVLEEYPVLARQALACVDQWVHVSLEFVRRLCDDWAQIGETFGPTDCPGKLTHLEGDAGDRHRGGRSVFIATFESGLRLVYKPRPLAVDLHFQELLAWLNERGSHPPFRLLRIIDRGEYGWVEYVTASGCASTEEVQRFYERQGGYLAICYALNAVDLHHENLVAAGEQPMLVDVEALFHQNVQEAGASEASLVASMALDRSVLGVGLLPQRLFAGAGRDVSFEVSGLGGAPGQMTPFPVPTLEGVATDEMRVVRERIEVEGQNNRPKLNDTEVNLLEHTEDVVRGFTEIYKLMVLYADDLSSEEGPLARFADDEVRYIARPTQVYSSCLIESFHPDLLRDGLRRDRFFDSLWMSSKTSPKLSRLFRHEREDLQRGDVPVFVARPGSRALWSSCGQRIAEYFDVPALELARKRVQELNDEDMARQTWFIRASFASLIAGEGRSQWPYYDLPGSEVEADEAELLAAASEVGDRLGFLALRGDKDATWLGLGLERFWTMGPSSTDLYNGLCGIALFLAYLGSVTGDRKHTALAESATTTILRHWDRILATPDLPAVPRQRLSLGAFSELGGTIYTLTHLGVLWERPDLLDKAEVLSTELLPPLIDRDEHLDVLSGAAGSAGILSNLYRFKPTDRILALAVRCGDRVLSRAQKMERGIGWPSPFNSQPLAGFSHGAAGIAWALFELANCSGEQRFRDAALLAIEYERSLFSFQHGNWPDLRDFDVHEEPGNVTTPELNDFFVGWCHGAPGIGLSRLCAMGHVDDTVLREEVDVAVRTVFEEGLGLNHSLCHGDLGNLELPLRASEVLDDLRLRSRVYRTAAGILKSIDERGWLCGVPEGIETPGLMEGLAGIGYGLLRLGAPDRVPPILTLAPPIARNQQ